jgi:hypothetical protein
MAGGMASVNEDQAGTPRSRRISALPSVRARVLAFASILAAGICGGLIGSSYARVSCHGNCSTPEGIGGVTGAVFAAVGVAVIAVLVLRAMAEWRTIKEQRALDAAELPPAAAPPEEPPAY